jgi:LCP family protein required for cell wall assembly
VNPPTSALGQGAAPNEVVAPDEGVAPDEVVAPDEIVAAHEVVAPAIVVLPGEPVTPVLTEPHPAPIEEASLVVAPPVATTRPPSGRKRAVAALLSFIWPGLGQAYLGRKDIAWLMGAPPIGLAIGLVMVAATISPLIIVAYLLNPVLAALATVIAIVLGIIRSVSILETAFPQGGRPALVAAGLVVVVVITHAWLAASTWAFYRAGQQIFEQVAAVQQDDLPPDPTLAPGQTLDPNATPRPTRRPTAAPGELPGERSRVTVLLVGVDNTHDEDRGLTDTLIVASFDPLTHSLTMVSLPRDVGRLPFYAGGTYGPRVNTLMQSADRHPEDYPDGPMGTLINEMSYLVGIPIDYYARIDIAGFRSLVDSVGGVDILVETTIDDPGYGFSPDEIGFHLDPGLHHLDGKYATAYARSRHGSSDYERARRQQQILLALRGRLGDPSVIARLPEIVGAVSSIIRTDAPLDRLPDILQVVLNTDDAATRHIVLSPPRYAHRAADAIGSINQLDMFAVAELSLEIYGQDSLYAEAPPAPSPSVSPTPTEAATPTATPTASASPTPTRRPTATPSPTRTERPTKSPKPTKTPKPTRSPRATASP